ncbi:Putative DNA-binding protein in cluster with Type I restriction-modification system [uncultured Gammaproteobacteria bacterium]|nr:Putative DNA-binding protein in cluster with Type I restriction-modification system [uncultured Gammaproteobacteria bacterium]CAC9614413.1 Putative DNA-binding protein in cluster with Type I restriction-modification system [uncultured Gammaproteobacteria bacterium]
MTNSQIILYKTQTGEIKIDVHLEDDTVWLNRHQLSNLFDRDIKTIGKHIGNIFKEGELSENSVVANFATTATDDKTYQIDHYNLEMIIALGYRVKSPQGTQFRIWAIKQLKEYISKGFVLDDERFKAGDSMSYFDELQERIREIRISERFFYQKIKDIYTTSIDYDAKSDKTSYFFKVVQNKLLWAISQQSLAELEANIKHLK